MFYLTVRSTLLTTVFSGFNPMHVEDICARNMSERSVSHMLKARQRSLLAAEGAYPKPNIGWTLEDRLDLDSLRVARLRLSIERLPSTIH